MHRHAQRVSHHKPSEVLHVIAVVSNPVRYKSRYELFKQFMIHMRQFNVDLTVVELAYGCRDFEIEDAGHLVRVRSDHELWHKENLINLGLQTLPNDWRYAAWIDADVTFTNAQWVEETIHALQHHPVVQIFQDALDLGPDGRIIQAHKGFGFSHCEGRPRGPGYTFWHPGFAWAIRRDALDALGGLIDWAVLGAGDHHMALALIGEAKGSIPGGIHRNYIELLNIWQDRAVKHLHRDVGYVPGTLLHNWHGKKKDRRYVERWGVLIDHQFDPMRDVKKDHQGVWALEHGKPAFRDALRRYFRARFEDSTDLE